MSAKLYDAAFGVTSVTDAVQSTTNPCANQNAFPSLLSFGEWDTFSDMGRIYLVLSAFVLAYIVKLLMAEGWPSFVIERINSHALLSPLSSDVTIYMGTVKRGLGLNYVVNLQERRFAISFIAKQDEGKMLMMIALFPFSIFLTIVVGIMIDAGEIRWTVRCDHFVDTFGRVFEALLR